MQTILGTGTTGQASATGEAGASGATGQAGGQLVGGAGTAPAELIKDSDTAGFAADVIEASVAAPVIVDFWAPWCGPCKTLGPALESAVAKARGKVRMVKINVDENQQLAAQLRIQSLPTVLAFANGQPVDGFTGALPESQINAFIDKLIKLAGPKGDPIDEALAQAKALMDAGDGENAAALYSRVLQADPENAAAVAGLAGALVKAGNMAEAKSLYDNAPEAMRESPEMASVKAALDLAEAGAKAAAEIGQLEARLKADPKDMAARFDLASALFASGNRETAIGQLLELIGEDREWNDAAARKQLLKFFEAMGPTDPLTVAGRRRLSALLFS